MNKGGGGGIVGFWQIDSFSGLLPFAHSRCSYVLTPPKKDSMLSAQKALC